MYLKFEAPGLALSFGLEYLWYNYLKNNDVSVR